MHEEVLLHMDFCHMVQLLTKLPDDLSGDNLFKNIEAIKMNIDKKRFTQVLASRKESWWQVCGRLIDESTMIMFVMLECVLDYELCDQ